MLETVLFFIVLLIIIDFIVYFGYPLAIHVSKPKDDLVSYRISDEQKAFHIIPVYNEEKVLDEKITNCISMNSRLSLKHVFVLDQSSDSSSSILRKYHQMYPTQIEFIDKGFRKGKNDSINQAIESIKPGSQDVLYFSDANTLFQEDAFELLLAELEKGYELVGGSMHYYDEVTGTAKSEGLYWRYEEWIRKNEAKLGKCLVVNGGNFAMLARNFEKLPAFVPNDFEAPLRICGSGKHVGFCKEAIGNELAVSGDSEEMKRKKRMGNRQMNCIKYLWPRLNFSTKLQVIIRKLLRWMGFHLAVFALLLGVFVYFISPGLLTSIIGSTSVVSLISIVAIEILYKIGVRNKAIDILHHLIAVHISSFSGVVSSAIGQKVEVWNKAESNR